MRFKKSDSIKTFLILNLMLNVLTLKSQCLNEITHSSGTYLINGILVTVTSTGNIQQYNSTPYCDNNISNGYSIGINNNGDDGDGSYSFSFTPPISNVTLNLKSLDNWSSHKEEIKLFINGNHYPVNNPGSQIECYSAPLDLAIINTEGNIIADPVTHHGAWKEFTINEQIETITIMDDILYGTPRGVLFNIFVCGQLNINELNEKKNVILYPNPFKEQMNIQLSEAIKDGTIEIYNLFGQTVKKIKVRNTNSVLLSRDNLSSGVYLLKIVDEGKIYLNTKIIIN